MLGVVDWNSLFDKSTFTSRCGTEYQVELNC